MAQLGTTGQGARQALRVGPYEAKGPVHNLSGGSLQGVHHIDYHYCCLSWHCRTGESVDSLPTPAGRQLLEIIETVATRCSIQDLCALHEDAAPDPRPLYLLVGSLQVIPHTYQM